MGGLTGNCRNSPVIRVQSALVHSELVFGMIYIGFRVRLVVQTGMNSSILNVWLRLRNTANFCCKVFCNVLYLRHSQKENGREFMYVSGFSA